MGIQTNICRLCIQEVKKDDETVRSIVAIIDIVNETCGVNISATDNKSKKICAECLENVLCFYSFRHSVQEKQKAIDRSRSIIQQINIEDNKSQNTANCFPNQLTLDKIKEEPKDECVLDIIEVESDVEDKKITEITDNSKSLNKILTNENDKKLIDIPKEENVNEIEENKTTKCLIDDETGPKIALESQENIQQKIQKYLITNMENPPKRKSTYCGKSYSKKIKFNIENDDSRSTTSTTNTEELLCMETNSKFGPLFDEFTALGCGRKDECTLKYDFSDDNLLNPEELHREHLTHFRSHLQIPTINDINGSPTLIYLHRLINNPDLNHIIHWTRDGRNFIIKDAIKFSNNILSKRKKYNNMRSFVNLIKSYGFKKVRTKSINCAEQIFTHPYFKRDAPCLIKDIKKKC